MNYLRWLEEMQDNNQHWFHISTIDWLTANGAKDDIDDIGVKSGPMKRQDKTEDERQK